MNPPEAAEAAAAEASSSHSSSFREQQQQHPDPHRPYGIRGPTPLDSTPEAGSDPSRPSISCLPQQRQRRLRQQHPPAETLETGSEASCDDYSYFHSDDSDSSDSSVISVGGLRTQEEALDLKMLRHSNETHRVNKVP